MIDLAHLSSTLAYNRALVLKFRACLVGSLRPELMPEILSMVDDFSLTLVTPIDMDAIR